MPFANDLDLFINTLNDALDGPLDEAFVGLIRAKATEVFEPVYKATPTASVAGAPMTGGVPATPAVGAVVAKTKKAATAYNLFLKDYSSKHPGTANLMKVVGAVWKGMDDVAKAPFVEKAAQEKEQHDKAIMAVAPVAQVGQATTAQVGQTAPVAVAGTPAKKTPKKRGPTGYNVYTSEVRTNKELTMKEVGAMWKAMSAAEQQPYLDKAKAQATPPAAVATTK